MIMKILTIQGGSLFTNCYMVWNENSDKCVLIDPGFQAEQILEHVRREGKQVEAVLLTHGHFDHVGGVNQLAEQTGCRVWLCREDLELDPMLTAGTIRYTDTYAEGDVLELAGLTLRVMQTPGHTPGSVCLVCEDTIFSGDTLFAGSCGRTDFPGSSVRQMRQSLARLAAMEGNYRVLPGHGEGTTLEAERKSNPFLQSVC